MRKITFVGLTALLICLTACSSKSTVYVDNPTDQAITVAIDGKEAVAVAPNEFKQLEEMEQGEHAMKVNGGEEVKFKLTSSKTLLNPCKSNYFIYKEVYGDESDTDKALETMYEDGSFAKLVSDVAIDLSAVDYLINEELPSQVQMLQSETIKYKTKVFGEKQLIAYFKKEGMDNVQMIIDAIKSGKSIKEIKEIIEGEEVDG